MLEIWKPVVGFEEFYEVSNCGNVRSKDRLVWRGKSYYKKPGIEMRKSPTTTGYWKIRLTDKNGLGKDHKVHRLVAAAFIPNPEGKPFINHIDGNPLNNHVSNLEWCTQSENMYHAYRTGLRKTNFHKYKNDIIREYSNNPDIGIRELSLKYKCSHASITKTLRAKGIEIKPNNKVRDKYKIDRKELVFEFESGLSNKEIAKKHNTNSTLIATYRYKYKKGELIL
jgi:hypothetical protein